MAATLTQREIAALYDRIGRRQDWQAFYERPATDDLVRHARLEEARSVLEFGCGTGSLAASLLAARLPEGCRYLAVDSSTTMVALARARLRQWSDRAEVRLTDGSIELAIAGAEFDRVLSAYVLDLLSEDDIRRLLAEAHRLLAPGGRLGIVGLTWGERGLARLTSRLWSIVHRLNPRLVGGCRPLHLAGFLPRASWRLEYRNVLSPWGVSSEVVVARRGGAGNRGAV